VAGTLAVTSDVAVNTNKFTVAASSGNTVVAGTLGVTGDVAVNTNKFTVAASSGNTAIAGDLTVTGTGGNVALLGTAQTFTAAKTFNATRAIFSGAGYANTDGSIAANATYGIIHQAATGSSYDWVLLTPGGSADIIRVVTGTSNVQIPSGSLVVGAPTGGSQGAGTINATGVYDDGVLLTDWVYDLHYDGTTDLPVPVGGRLYSLDETESVTRSARRLPWMPTRESFAQDRALGLMTTKLWFGQEQQQIYISALSARIAQLEAQLARRID
jgi:hypothetical protein